MTEEQFTELIDAILAGKYSWACVLILRAAGYNPLHYIPYRTYNRLVKSNRFQPDLTRSRETVTGLSENSHLRSERQSTKIVDLDHFTHQIDLKREKITGGNGLNWFVFSM